MTLAGEVLGEARARRALAMGRALDDASVDDFAAAVSAG
jgi:hypothetical protein